MPKNPTFATLLSLALGCAPLSWAAVHTVTTTDNNSPANDGLLSLKEAIQQLQDGDTIAFNLPGEGPHYIITPEEGYPLITRRNITIDGYTQPGAVKNTNPLNQPNLAKIQVVLDSRDGGRRVLSAYADNGFGPTESAVLPLLNAANAQIRGLAFIGVHGSDSEDDPVVYNIALIGASTNVKIQGCWFGLDPAAAPFTPDAEGKTPGVYGARAAVASFPWDNNTTSSGLIFGTDGDGQDDRSEFNIVVGQGLAIHLAAPRSRVSGNYINYLPDGRVFDWAAENLNYDSVEFYENGQGHDALIGTDGNGISDADEGNYVGPVNYNVYMEFWRAAERVVIAGNHFGVGPSGALSYATPPETRLAVFRAQSTVRIGSNFDGVSDGQEANHIAEFGGNLLAFHGSNANADSTPARIVMRGNVLQLNYSDTPINLFQDLDINRFYEGILTDPETIPEDPDYYFRPYLDPSSTPAAVKGTVPLPLNPAGFTIHVDFYLADPEGLWLGDEFNPKGFPQGLVYLGSRQVDGPEDTDADQGAFMFTNLPGLTSANMNRLICAAYYKSASAEAVSLFSHPPEGMEMSVEMKREGNTVQLRWLGGTAPYTVDKTASFDNWTPTTTNQRSVLLSSPEPSAFFRVRSKE